MKNQTLIRYLTNNLGMMLITEDTLRASDRTDVEGLAALSAAYGTRMVKVNEKDYQLRRINR